MACCATLLERFIGSPDILPGLVRGVSMQVLDHAPRCWFLFKEGDILFFDVNCDHGPVGYCVMIQLNAEEEAEYASKGRAFLDELARAVQDAGPGSAYQKRNVSSTYMEKSTAAFREWQSARNDS